MQLVLREVASCIRLANQLPVVSDKFIKHVNSVPNSFNQMTRKAIQRVINIKKCCPQLFVILVITMKFNFSRSSILCEVFQVLFQDKNCNISADLFDVLKTILDQLPVLGAACNLWDALKELVELLDDIELLRQSQLVAAICKQEIEHSLA